MKYFRFSILAILSVFIVFSGFSSTFIGERSDFRDETIYFVMTTRFYDGDPMNNVLSWDKQEVQKQYHDPDWRGDFAGLIEKLDYIKALGFTSVWITPITQNASGEDYHGYHSMDFSSVDLRYESRKEWGSTQDVKFQDLIDAAHSKGMKVILDIVLNHTSNFGEAHLNPLFIRDQNIKNQATPAGALIPNSDRFSDNYFDQDGNKQYQERFKYFKNPQYDVHNIYHHYGTGWNWDLPNRWWAQIAGDCVDLNTENDAVAQYLVDCYGEFIKMGVDGFRIDTTGHIARLTFNTQFIPKFLEIAEQYKSKRLNECPFFMFGECCARFGSVIYRNQHNLSSHFYTWKSESSLMATYKSHSSQEWWDTQVLNEGHDTPVGPMIDCESEKSFNKNSTNVFMQNGAWHKPDYTEYSGFSVIDFPMHYNFNNAEKAINIAKEGDKYYNDASYNVVYVDSHDYCPGPNDGTRFNEGTEQWAENLSLMFTFRGIPCIYYGSEVEFKKGLPIDVGGENNKTPRSQSGRAYYGEYLEGSVSASDFGQYTASGNVQATLNGDLSQHIRRLNLIRAAVPALRKGQYTFEGCSASGGFAFKRAYNEGGIDSYALVALNGGATFTNLPAGTYVDVTTGESYSATEGGSIKVTAPNNKGQLRVLVKNWTGGKIGEDGMFIYDTKPVPKGGNVSFPDRGASRYYTADDVVGRPAVKFSPAGGSFKTETLTVTVTLNDAAVSGTYNVEGEQPVNLSRGMQSTFTIGEDMKYGETKMVTWSAMDGNESYSGTLTYKKVDPLALITVYVEAPNGGNLYAWAGSTEYLGAWPGKAFTSLDKTEIDGKTFYFTQFDAEIVNVIFNNNGNQTGNIEGITSDKFFRYEGGTSYTELTDVSTGPIINPAVTFSPTGGRFTESVDVSIGLNQHSVSGTVFIDGQESFTILPGEKRMWKVNETTIIKWTATAEDGTIRSGQESYIIRDPSETGFVFLKNTKNWGIPMVWAWNDTENCTSSGKWGGDRMTKVEGENNLWVWYVPSDKSTPTQLVFNNNSGNGDNQTANLKWIDGATYDCNGNIIDGNDQGSTDTEGFDVFFDNSKSNWSNVYIHFWGGTISSSWPGFPMTELGNNLYGYNVAEGTTGLVFHNNTGTQTNDLSARPYGIYDSAGDTGKSGVEDFTNDSEDSQIHFYNLQGIEISKPKRGI